MTDRDLELARALKRLLDDDPGATARELASRAEAPEADVVRVLDEWAPAGPRGGLERVGPGMGGGWVDGGG